jgi:hypothetical protein
MPTIETRLLYLDHIERDLEGVVAKCARGTYRLTAAPRPGSRSRIPITRRCATATSCSLRARLLHIEVGHWAAPTFCFGDPESRAQPHGSSRRVFAWEIHPIHAIQVCIKRLWSGCPGADATKCNRWTNG